MIIDAHAHNLSGPSLNAYYTQLLANGGTHGREPHKVSDDEVDAGLNRPVFGESR